MTRARFYVRVDRSDGSRTYKGAWTRPHCEREAQAWRDEFPTYAVDVLPRAVALPDFRRWSRVVRAGIRYFPAQTDNMIGPRNDWGHQGATS